MTRRTREEYDELLRLIEEAETAVARVQGKLMDLFPVFDPDNRPFTTRYDEKALDMVYALDRLRSELELERQNEVGGPEIPGGGTS
jgi:threonyl-tRNA synthetase